MKAFTIVALLVLLGLIITAWVQANLRINRAENRLVSLGG